MRTYSFSELVGLEKNVVLFVLEEAQKTEIRITQAIPISELATACKTTIVSAKRTIATLKTKRILEKTEFKNGRGGWSKYRLSDPIYSEIASTITNEKLVRTLEKTNENIAPEPQQANVIMKNEPEAASQRKRVEALKTAWQIKVKTQASI